MRLIDADAALELFGELGDRDYRRKRGTICEASKMLMHEEYTPTIEAEPVRHGHWEHPKDDFGFVACRCSVCKKDFMIYEDDIDGYSYCANCGAKMDEASE